MKIGIDIRTLMDIRYSGVAEYAYRLVSALLAIDRENEYVLFYNSGKDVSGRLPKFDSAKARLVPWRYPNKIFNYGLQKFLHWPKIDRRLGVDLFFLPHLNFTALSGHCPSVLTVHDLSFALYPEYYSLRKRFWHRLLNAKKQAKAASRLVVPSQSTKSDVVGYFDIEPEKIEVIPHGLSPEFRLIDPNEPGLARCREKYGLPPKFILFLGTLEPRKNVVGLINAFSEFKKSSAGRDYALVLAGGRGWKTGAIDGAYAQSEFRKDIRFLDYVAAVDRPCLYALADMFVYPSFYEGFGLPVLEAMACGCPVVASNVTSLPEVAGSAALLINPHKTSEIAAAMEQVAADGALRRELSEKGMKRAGEFSWGKASRDYLELFRALALTRG